MTNRIKNFVFILITIIASLAQASNYYLDPINGSLSNDGSSENPWSDLKTVLIVKTIADGDTLFLRNGFHGFNFGVHGEHNLPSVITPDKGHSPTLLNVYINGSNWILDGLTFTPEGNRGHEIRNGNENGRLLIFSSTSSNNIVKNCDFYSSTNSTSWSIENWRDSVWSGIFDYGDGNTVHDNLLKNLAYGYTAFSESDGSIFRNNIVEIFSGDGVRCAGAQNLSILNNTVKNAVELDPDPIVNNHEDGIQGWGDNVGLIVSGNLVYSNTGNDTIPFVGSIQGIVIFDGSTTNALFENNVVITEHWHGLTVLGSYNSKYVNNTILPVPGVNSYQGPPWLRVDKKKDGTSSSGNIIRNNLATDLVIESGSSISDHNVIDDSASLFTNDYFNWDFSPKEDFLFNGKTIIDAGSPDNAPNYDINGETRPQGNGYDIGAFESSFFMDPPPNDLLTTFTEDFNGVVDTSFWQYNWSAGEIVGDRDEETFKYVTDSLNNYYLGILLDFENTKSTFVNLTENPYLIFRARVNGEARINGAIVDSIPIGMDLINPAGDNIGAYYTKVIIPADGEWHECMYDFSELGETVSLDSIAKIRFNPGKERFDGFAFYSGSVSIDDFKLGEAAFAEIDPGDPIVYKAIPKLSDKFYASWKVIPTHKPMDGVTGFSKGEVSTFSDMGILVRFKDNKIDAYNGSGYEAENNLIFEAEEEYIICVSADINTQTYTVDVAPSGSADTIRIGTDFNFRSVNPQDTLSYFAMVINELETFGGVKDSRLKPSFMDDDYELNFIENNEIDTQTGRFSLSFNLIPTAQNLNSAIALLNGNATLDGWDDLSVVLRLNDQNKFDVKDGDQFRADSDLEYIEEKMYLVTIYVNISEQSYSITVLPQGKSQVNLATNYSFGAAADKLTTLARLTTIGGLKGGSVGDIIITSSLLTDVNPDKSTLPKLFSLSQNYPNPFNPNTVINYSIPKVTNVNISIFNSIGQKVNTLVHQKQGVGNYSVNWDASDKNGNGVSSGIYFYQIKAGDFVQTKKMLYLQ